jgi:hypothetical protein
MLRVDARPSRLVGQLVPITMMMVAASCLLVCLCGLYRTLFFFFQFWRVITTGTCRTYCSVVSLLAAPCYWRTGVNLSPLFELLLVLSAPLFVGG